MKQNDRYYKKQMEFMQALYEAKLRDNRKMLADSRKIIAILEKYIEKSDRLEHVNSELMSHKLRVGDILERYRKN